MRFCFHDWSKWSAPKDTAHDYKKVQSRYCNKCNKVKVARVSQPFNLWFNASVLEQPTGETK